MAQKLDSLTIGRAAKWALVCVAGLSALVIVGSMAGLFTSVATAPSRVLSRTLDTDNIIHNYEWFYDTQAAFIARVAQIKSYKALATNQTAKMELAAMRQSCRTIATKYNANSAKVNRSIFKGSTVSQKLNIRECET